MGKGELHYRPGTYRPHSSRKVTMSSIARRSFLLAAGAALAVPLTGCGGGGGEPLPPVAPMSAPTAVSTQGAQFAALPMSHAIEVTSASGTKRRVAGVGQTRGRFNYPADFAVIGETGYVVETGNHRV